MLICKEVIIHRPISEVYNYVLHFSHLYEWDDQVTQGEQLDLGPIQEGHRFLFTYSLGGREQELLYTLESLEENKFVKFVCKKEGFCAVDTIRFQEHQNGQTKVTYQADIQLNSKFQEFFLSLLMDGIGKRVVSRLKEVLEREDHKQDKAASLNLLNLSYWFSVKGWNKNRKHFFATPIKSKKVLITGPTSGLGESVVFNLASKGCELILVGRNKEKLNHLEQKLRDQGMKKSLRSYICDMQNLKSVGYLCEQLIASGENIDVLINNAGALYDEAKTIEGIERTTVVDLIAPWILSCKLKPLMKKGSCIINVSSGGMYSVGLDIEKLKKASEPFSGSKAYALAKRGMFIFSQGLNQQYSKEGIRVHCMHPGWANTPGVQTSLPGFFKVTKRWLRTSFQGADTIVWLAMKNPKEGGKFWLDRKTWPVHILNSTRPQENEYRILMDFLKNFAI